MESGADSDCELEVAEAPTDLETCTSIQDVFRNTNAYFGKKFHTAEKKIKMGLKFLSNTSKNLQLKIKTDLEETWLGKPKGSEDGVVGTWNPSKLQFTSKWNWVPEKYSKEHPKRVPFKLESGEDEEFFTEKYLVSSSKKFALPTGIFSPNSTSVETKMNLFEYWGRQGTLDCEITHNILDLCADMTASVLNVIKELDLSQDGAQDTLEGVKINLENILNFNTLACQSNYRSKSFSILTCVNAKLELRSLILDKYDGEADIIEKLKHSNLFTNTVFGPIPKELYITGNSCASRKAPLQAKFRKGFGKRGASNLGSQNKRGKFDFNNNVQVRHPSNFNKSNYNNQVNHNTQPNFESRYASHSLFPKVNQRGAKQRGGKRGFKS